MHLLRADEMLHRKKTSMKCLHTSLSMCLQAVVWALYKTHGVQVLWGALSTHNFTYEVPGVSAGSWEAGSCTLAQGGGAGSASSACSNERVQP